MMIRNTIYIWQFGSASALEPSTNLHEVSQCPETAPFRAFTLLKAPIMAFSGHCATSRRFHDTSNQHSDTIKLCLMAAYLHWTQSWNMPPLPLLNSTPISTNIYILHPQLSSQHKSLMMKMKLCISKIVSINALLQSLKKETVASATYHYYAPQNTPISAIM